MRAGEGGAVWNSRFTDPSPVSKLRFHTDLKPELPNEVQLPWVVRWALSLNEGDLLAVSRDDSSGHSRFRFRSFRRRARTAWECCAEPWPFVEELLRLPLAAIEAAGSLKLDGFEPGELLALAAQVGHEEPWFTLERAGGCQPSAEPVAFAQYRLAVESGFKVRLPADALFALSLMPGSSVGYSIALWVLEGWPAGERASSDRLEIGDGGVLPLPPKLRVEAGLRPGNPVKLEVSLSTRKSYFQLEPDLF